MKKNILICGDSFAADWCVKYPGAQGWPNRLAQEYTVNNLAQAGCSEYKIFKQLTSVNLDQYDWVIVSHTSPYRIPITKHPIHFHDPLHKNSDLIYADIKEHSKDFPDLIAIVNYFEKYFDTEYANFMHNLICQQINQLLINSGIPYINLVHINWDNLYMFSNLLNFEKLFNTQQGSVANHYNQVGNQTVFLEIKKHIETQ
jgi:hypothetical protein